MKLQTKYLGETEVDEEKIIHFSSGIPGFINETRFVLLNMPEGSAFQMLQSAETPDLAFIVVNPYDFYQGYVIDLDDNIIDSLGIQEDRDVIILAIVTVKESLSASTMNLKAPIIINSQNKRGKQYILDTDDYSSKALLTLSASSSVKGE